MSGSGNDTPSFSAKLQVEETVILLAQEPLQSRVNLLRARAVVRNPDQNIHGIGGLLPEKRQSLCKPP